MVKGNDAMPDLLHFFLELHLNNKADSNEIDLLTRQLGNEIKDFTFVQSIELAGLGDLPQGTKATDPVTIGVLVVATLPSVLPALIEFIKSWTLRANNRTVIVKVQEGDKSVEVSYPISGDLSKEETLSLVHELRSFLKENDS